MVNIFVKQYLDSEKEYFLAQLIVQCFKNFLSSIKQDALEHTLGV